MAMPDRESDRFITPRVVVVLVLAATVLCVVVLGCVTYLTARGFDPQPVVQLVGTLVAAAASLGGFVVSLVQRRTSTNVQRRLGRLEPAVLDTLDELDARAGRYAEEPAGPLEEDDRTRPHPLAAWERPPVQPGRRES